MQWGVDQDIKAQVKSEYGSVATSGLSTDNDGVKAVAQPERKMKICCGS